MDPGLVSDDRLTLGRKLLQLDWLLVALLCVIAGIGAATLYSAGRGSWDPWASRHALRFAVALVLMLAVALVDVRFWMRHAYAIYAGALALLIGVEAAGSIGMGAKRWLDLGAFQIQPSEIMKIALVVGLARYFHGASVDDVRRPRGLAVPALMIAAPAALVLRQPDLGTAVILVLGGAAVMFVVGVRLWKFAVTGGLALAALPVLWWSLEEYQRQRVRTFLDPGTDPDGAGYHILQAMIALGSGGLFGKGFMQGTQSHLYFLPERQTDFVFTVLAEEFGLLGGLGLLGLFCVLVIYAAVISIRVRNQFGRVLGVGIAATVALYVFINVAMVMGLVPVVGIPLPLISYGGTAMLAVMIGFGLLLSASIHRDAATERRADFLGF